VTFDAGGGSAIPGPALDNLPAGTTCTVTERNSAGFPAGSAVSYSPAQTVAIPPGDQAPQGVTVTVTNDFSGVAIQRGEVVLHKVVDNPSGLPTPPDYTARIECDDGPNGAIGTDVSVTMPDTGGVGAPVVRPKVGADCGVVEGPTSVPPDWTVTYSVNGGPAAEELPFFTVASTTTINITITNTSPTPPPATDTLTVFKTVVPPNPAGVPVTPLPTSYTAVVDCPSDPAHRNVTVTFPASGGQGTPQLSGIPINTRCTVVEQNPPGGATVTYFPPDVDTVGVIIGEGPGVQVGIVNDFSDAPLRTGTIRVDKVVNNPSGVPTPANFTAHVVCDDGPNGTVGTDVRVTLPGTGGAGSPVVHPKLGFTCAVTETSRPDGWTASYVVNGTSTGAAPATFRVTTATPNATVTITNLAPEATTTPPFVPGPGATGDTPVGHGQLWPVVSAAAAAGLAVGVLVRLRRGRGRDD
jgi:hypothetical protein